MSPIWTSWVTPLAFTRANREVVLVPVLKIAHELPATASTFVASPKCWNWDAPNWTRPSTPEAVEVVSDRISPPAIVTAPAPLVIGAAGPQDERIQADPIVPPENSSRKFGASSSPPPPLPLTL